MVQGDFNGSHHLSRDDVGNLTLEEVLRLVHDHVQASTEVGCAIQHNIIVRHRIAILRLCCLSNLDDDILELELETAVFVVRL